MSRFLTVQVFVYLRLEFLILFKDLDLIFWNSIILDPKLGVFNPHCLPYRVNGYLIDIVTRSIYVSTVLSVGLSIKSGGISSSKQ